MRPVAVASGQAALEELRLAASNGAPFSLLLLDAVMPEMDGFALLEVLRQQPKVTGAVVMMLSSGDRQGDAARCRSLGVARHLIKPVKPSDLLDAILTALGGASAGQRRQEDTPVAAPVVTPRRILLAEDNPVNQMLTVRLLEKQGHQVVVASSGREAVLALETHPFDLVLMDVQMPEMSGLEAAVAIREREKATGGHVPIIALTAHAMKGDREECMAAGMDDYVSKPIQPQELYDAVARQVSQPPQPGQAPSATTVGQLDRGAALSRAGGDPELLRDLIDLFLDDCPKLLAEINTAVLRRDSLTLQRCAHRLKGEVGIFDEGPAFEAADRLELLGRKGDFRGVEEAHDTLRRELLRLHPLLMNLLSTFASC
jgi:CheY-like chemotaxis protein